MMSLSQQVVAEEQVKPMPMLEKIIYKIMIVDDDIELLEELNEVLSFNKYEVETISDSTLAFEKACTLRPDLVILDLKMKTKNGFQLADELHHSFKTKSIPLIAITGFFTQQEHTMMMKLCGIKSTLLKPIDPESLLVKIASVLNDTKDHASRSIVCHEHTAKGGSLFQVWCCANDESRPLAIGWQEQVANHLKSL